MVLEEEYSQGLYAFLNGNVEKKDLAEITRAILYYTEYVVPGVWFYRELKRPKEERTTGRILLSSAIAAGFVAKLTLAYVGKGVTTGNWHPLQFNSKAKTEHVEEIPKDNKVERQNGLEKTIDYEQLFR